MLANIKKHAAYIGSTVGYISDQISADKQIILDSAVTVNFDELLQISVFIVAFWVLSWSVYNYCITGLGQHRRKGPLPELRRSNN